MMKTRGPVRSVFTVERGWRPKQWLWPGPARWSSASVSRSGASPNGRTGHWDWLRYRIGKNLPVTIVHDEYRSVVWAHDLALRVMRMAESGAAGIRHVSATRVISRVELANHLLTLFGEPASYESESRHQRSAPHLGPRRIGEHPQRRVIRTAPMRLWTVPMSLADIAIDSPPKERIGGLSN